MNPAPLAAAGDTRLRPVAQWRMALRDIVGGLAAYRVWSMLARMDIKQRYRRSILDRLATITMMVGPAIGAVQQAVGIGRRSSSLPGDGHHHWGGVGGDGEGAVPSSKRHWCAR